MAKNGLSIKVKSGNHGRKHCPVTVEVPVVRLPERGPGGWQLVRTSDEKVIPVHSEARGDKVALCWILDELGPEEELSFLVTAAQEEPEMEAGVSLKADVEQVDVFVAEQYFTSYVFSREYAKPYLGPVIGPYGDGITRLDPTVKEHPHHRSIWISHGDVNGVDTWNEPEGRYGKELHKDFTEMQEGPVLGRLQSGNTWTSFDGQPLLDDVRTFTFYNTPQSARLIDVEVVLKAAHGRVELGPTKEAGPLGVRVAPTMTGKAGGWIENAYGARGESETWGKPAHWCDYVGPVAGKLVGIAVFDSPDNKPHPTFWHVRDYGLMAPNNFHFAGPVTLEKGESVTYRYRLYFHAGDTAAAQVKDRYLDYIVPPQVELVEE